MQDKEPERGVAALRRAEGDTVLREKNPCDDAVIFGISITQTSSHHTIVSGGVYAGNGFCPQRARWGQKRYHKSVRRPEMPRHFRRTQVPPLR